MIISILLKKHSLKYETDSYRGFDFHGCKVEFNENTKLIDQNLKN